MSVECRTARISLNDAITAKLILIINRFIEMVEPNLYQQMLYFAAVAMNTGDRLIGYMQQT